MPRKPYTPWTNDEKLLLKRAYPETKPGDLVVLFGKKFDAKQINQKAKKLGVKKSAAYCAANGIDAAGKRIKGGTPWNKGIPYHAGGKSIQTQFKKGHKLNENCFARFAAIEHIFTRAKQSLRLQTLRKN